MELSRTIKGLATRIGGFESRIDVLNDLKRKVAERLTEEQERHKALLPACSIDAIMEQFTDGDKTLMLNLLHQQIHTKAFCLCTTPTCRCIGRYVFKIDRQGNILDPATEIPLTMEKVREVRDKLLDEIKDTGAASYFFDGDELRAVHLWKLS